MSGFQLIEYIQYWVFKRQYWEQFNKQEYVWHLKSRKERSNNSHRRAGFKLVLLKDHQNSVRKQFCKKVNRYQPMIDNKSNQIMNFKVLLILLGLAFSVTAQGGGGRRSRSRSMKSRTSRKKIKTCQQHCKEIANNENYTFDECVNECEEQRGYILHSFLIIALGIFGFIVFCGVLAIISVVKQHLNRLKKLKNKFNVIDGCSTTSLQFEKAKDQMVKILTGSRTHQPKLLIYSKDRSHSYTSQINNVNIIKQDSFLSEMAILGTDQQGEWRSIAFIVNKKSGLFFWMKKQYLNKPWAKESGRWTTLLFESTNLSLELRQGINGKWYYLGLQDDQKYSGTWTLFKGAHEKEE